MIVARWFHLYCLYLYMFQPCDLYDSELRLIQNSCARWVVGYCLQIQLSQCHQYYAPYYVTVVYGSKHIKFYSCEHIIWKFMNMKRKKRAQCHSAIHFRTWIAFSDIILYEISVMFCRAVRRHNNVHFCDATIFFSVLRLWRKMSNNRMGWIRLATE